MAALFAFALSACSNASAASSSAEAQENEAAEEHAVAREDVEDILHRAAETTFSNITFATKTETTATGASSNGQQITQTIRTSMKGQLDKGGEKPKLHMSYEAQSNMELGKTTYEMFIDKDNLIVSQNEQLYVDAMTDEMLNSYADSVTSIMSADEIDSMLDMASNLKIQEGKDETTVTITIDKDKLIESEAVDESSLPETTQIATMVVSYTVDSDDRFKTVRLMSSTTGTPTYRVSQTYEFSNYDETTLPEWPDLDAYVAQQSGIKTDENGRMYIVGDDGQIYYVTEIGDDGMIYYDMGNTGAGGTTGDTYYETVETPTTTTTQTVIEPTATVDSTNTSTDTSNDKGRAYITADDGTIHYLDEEGSRLIQNDDGTSYFIDADGNFYFLSYEDDE